MPRKRSVPIMGTCKWCGLSAPEIDMLSRVQCNTCASHRSRYPACPSCGEMKRLGRSCAYCEDPRENEADVYIQYLTGVVHVRRVIKEPQGSRKTRYVHVHGKYYSLKPEQYTLRIDGRHLRHKVRV